MVVTPNPPGPEVSSRGERPRGPSESPYVRIRRQPLTKPSDQPLEGEAPEFDDRRHRSSFTRPSGSSAGEHSLIASRLRANPLGREHGECGRSGGITKLSSRPLAHSYLSHGNMNKYSPSASRMTFTNVSPLEKLQLTRGGSTA